MQIGNKKAWRDNIDIDAALQTFLLTYRNTTHCTIGETAALLLQWSTLRTHLDLLRYDREVEERMREAQQTQTENAGGVKRDFVKNNTIWARGYGRQET